MRTTEQPHDEGDDAGHTDDGDNERFNKLVNHNFDCHTATGEAGDDTVRGGVSAVFLRGYLLGVQVSHTSFTSSALLRGGFLAVLACSWHVFK